MDNPNLERLRAEVRRTRTNATRKAARYRRQGVRVAGSDFDPRRAVGAESRYNERQLKSYLNDLQGFTSRRTQFVGLSGGQPVTRQRFRQFEQTQQRFNLTRGYMSEGVESRRMPSGQTIAQERSMLRQDAYSNKILDRANLTPQNIASPQALDKLERRLRQRASPRGQRSDIRMARNHLNHMFTNTPGLSPVRADNLSDNDVLTLVSSTSFMESLGLIIDSPTGQPEERVGENAEDAHYSRVVERLNLVLER